MKENFDHCLDHELVFEGGTVDDVRDPGGRTNQGITQRVYSAWLRNNGKAPSDVFLMQAAERDAIYRLQYWVKIKGDNLPFGVDFVLLDCAVNSGVNQAVKWLQRVLAGFGYDGKIDGVLGEHTYAALMTVDAETLINGILDRRLAFCHALKTWVYYGHGWTNRIEQARNIGHVMAVEGTAPKPAFVPNGNRKADITDHKLIPSVAPGAATGAAGGAAVVSATTFLTAVKTQLDTIAVHLPGIAGVEAYITDAIAGLGIVGLVLGAAGGVWALYADKRAHHLHDVLDTNPAPVAAPAV